MSNISHTAKITLDEDSNKKYKNKEIGNVFETVNMLMLRPETNWTNVPTHLTRGGF